jgi:ABC-type uncharacterized transport system permease subunit
MVVLVVTVFAVIAYLATAALFGSDLLSEHRTATVGRIGYVLSVVLTTGVVAAIAVQDGAVALLRGGGLYATLAFVLGAGHAVVLRTLKIRAGGVLVAPLSALLLLASLLAPLRPATPEEAQQALIFTHVGLVLIGLGIFALAAVLAVLYLLQERQLRLRQFGPLFHRLPSLEELDTAHFRLVGLGFVVYTVALLLGFVWMFDTTLASSTSRIALALVAWAIFAGVIHTRITSGWRGRQSAWMTVIGCATTLLVLAGYSVS